MVALTFTLFDIQEDFIYFWLYVMTFHLQCLRVSFTSVCSLCSICPLLIFFSV